MNKFRVVLGIAAVATLAGCKDPNFKRSGTVPQNEVKDVETTPAPVAPVTPVTVEPVAPITVEPTTPKCTCPPGTKHAKPCTCGAPDCKCIVETKPVIVADISKKPVEPECTIYVVQNGDYLAKISKKYNVTISSIKRLNPSIKGDVIRVGQKLRIPGKIDIPLPVVASGSASGAAAVAKKPASKKGFTPYTGATKEYVVKNGDTLGSIAYGNGINIRQLKDLNGLTSDSLKIGQKLNVPTEKVAKAAKATKPVAADQVSKKADPVAKPVEAKVVALAEAASETKPEVDAAVEPAPAEVAAPVAESAADEKTEAVEPAAAEAAATTTYVVQEGDDITGVSIRWGVSAAEIRELNNLADGDQLVPGQIIKLPADAQQ